MANLADTEYPWIAYTAYCVPGIGWNANTKLLSGDAGREIDRGNDRGKYLGVADSPERGLLTCTP